MGSRKEEMNAGRLSVRRSYAITAYESRSGQDFFRPGADRFFHPVELLGEEMVGAGDGHALGVSNALDEVVDLGHVAVLILRPVNEEHRPLAVAQMAEVVLVHRRADEEERVDLRHLAGHTR